jgi:hypothetical protein
MSSTEPAGARLLLDRTFPDGDLFRSLSLALCVVVMLNRIHLYGLEQFC